MVREERSFVGGGRVNEPGSGGRSRGRGRADPTTSTEAAQDRTSAGPDEDVCRLEPAVYDVEIVQIGHDVGERGHETGGAFELEGADGLERMASDELGAQHDTVVVVLAGDELDDSRVTGGREQGGLVLEPNGVGLVARSLLGDDSSLGRHRRHDPSAHGVADYRTY
jgi:hypothetical protein